MTEFDPQQGSDKAAAFFERAKAIAEQGSYDYAINMYIEGLRCEPDDLKNGHVPLRKLALVRQGKKGKKPSMVERMKLSHGKTPIDQMLNAEYLLAKDPDHIPYAQAMLKAAYTGGYPKTTEWLADLVYAATSGSQKPSVHSYILLKDAYSSIGQYEKAIIACKKAAELKPIDAELDEEFKRLSAELTVMRGKYDQDGDFQKAIKNKDEQRKIQANQGVVKSDQFRNELIDTARKQLSADPTKSQYIFDLANALAATEIEDNEIEAIELLEDANSARGDFSFKQRAGEILICQLRRQVRKIRQKVENNPGDSEFTVQAAGAALELKETELQHWKAVVNNYPTDLGAKYEYGAKLLASESYDDAIPMLQQAQRDPRHKIPAMSMIGQGFMKKGWLTDAIEIFLNAIEIYEIKDDAVAKDLQYNSGLCYEQQGMNEKALEVYRKIAQSDFGYKDVSKRVDALRNKE